MKAAETTPFACLDALDHYTLTRLVAQSVGLLSTHTLYRGLGFAEIVDLLLAADARTNPLRKGEQ